MILYNKEKAETMANTIFLSSSDVSALLVGAAYAGSGMPGGGAGMVAIRSLLISVVARITSQSTMVGIDRLNENQKNQIVVAIAGAFTGYMRKTNPFIGMFSAVSVDLISSEILKLLSIEDKALVGGGSAVQV